MPAVRVLHAAARSLLPSAVAVCVATALAAAATVASAAPVALAATGSALAFAKASPREAMVSHANSDTPADPLAGFTIGAHALSVDLQNQDVQARVDVAIVAGWLDAAHGSVRMDVGWQTQNVTSGQIGVGTGSTWTYVFQSDADSVFRLSYATADRGPTGLRGFAVRWDDENDWHDLGVGDGLQLELAAAGGTAHTVTVMAYFGRLGALGTAAGAMRADIDWSIVSAEPPAAAVPEPGPLSLLATAMLGLVVRRRARGASR